MKLVSFIPVQCTKEKKLGCDQLVAYARFQMQLEKREEAKLQFSTTIFTCIVIAVFCLTLQGDIELIVVTPIKKIVDIIQRLAEGPLKKPD